jgi:hypothetical protein
MAGIRVRMKRACLLDGAGRGEGEVCEVAPTEAYLACSHGWAEYVNASDASRAREAAEVQQREDMRKLPQARGDWPASPWRRVA